MRCRSRYEARFDVDEDETFTPRATLIRRLGHPVWAVTIPANGRASLRYRISWRGRLADAASFPSSL